jgi:hypothetical protein
VADLQRLVGDQARAAAGPEQRIVICQYGGTPHPINDECTRVKVAEQTTWVSSAACAHAQMHVHPADGQCQYEPAAAVEPQPEGDLLDLVRQYGKENYECGAAEPSSHSMEADRHDDKARALIVQIEAEVQRLRVERDDYATLMKLTAAERDEALAGRRYALGLDSSGETIWAEGIIGGSLGEVLDGEPKGVRVEMAPPREPRTWPKLDDAPDDLQKVWGASSRTWVRNGRRWLGLGNGMECESFAELQSFDGPLAEVLDEPGGQR